MPKRKRQPWTVHDQYTTSSGQTQSALAKGILKFRQNWPSALYAYYGFCASVNERKKSGTIEETQQRRLLYDNSINTFIAALKSDVNDGDKLFVAMETFYEQLTHLDNLRILIDVVAKSQQ